MRALHPEVVEIADIGAAVWHEARSAEGRPWMLTNMISSVDGAAAMEGRSGALGGPADRSVFRALRGVADVVLVGASTVRAERYGPPTLDDEAIARRRAAGRQPLPRIAIVSGSLEIDLTLPLFSVPSLRPLVITHAGSAPDRRPQLMEVADVVDAGSAKVDPRAALSVLNDRGAGVVLCEGGPSLLGQFSAHDLVDEWCVTLGPVVTGGIASRLARSETPAVHELTLDRLWESDDLLFLRYLRRS